MQTRTKKKISEMLLLTVVTICAVCCVLFRPVLMNTQAWSEGLWGVCCTNGGDLLKKKKNSFNIRSSLLSAELWEVCVQIQVSSFTCKLSITCKLEHIAYMYDCLRIIKEFKNYKTSITRCGGSHLSIQKLL